MNCIPIALLAILLCGCATTRRAGHSMASAGSETGKMGNALLAGSAVCPLLIPIGIGVWIPMELTAALLYYPGCLLSGEEIELDPFEL